MTTDKKRGQMTEDGRQKTDNRMIDMTQIIYLF
jgi:hypothetical protein